MIASIGPSDLYRLTICRGRERVIRSPNAQRQERYQRPPQRNPTARITGSVSEAAVGLDHATGGLIEGNLEGNLTPRHGRGSKPEDGTGAIAAAAMRRE